MQQESHPAPVTGTRQKYNRCHTSLGAVGGCSLRRFRVIAAALYNPNPNPNPNPNKDNNPEPLP